MRMRTPNGSELIRFDRLREMGCIVCLLQGNGVTPPQIHHIDGKTKPGAHLKTIPLCHSHHQRGGGVDPIARHPYKARFEAAYGSENYLLEQTNERLG